MCLASFSTKTISAVQQIRRMRGGSQSHLMRADDGNLWIVKFQNNPQHVRVLANEFFVSRIGSYLDLPVPEVAVIEVCDWLINHTQALHMDVAGYQTPCSSGLQFASRYIDDIENTVVADYLPESMMLKNRWLPQQFAGILVLDKWTGNADGRQTVFTKPVYADIYDVRFIDQGYCFNAGEWNFPDLALTGVYYRNFVYKHVTGWKSFEPFLSRAEQMDKDTLWKLAYGIPEEWWNPDPSDEKFPVALSRLIDTLYQRRSKIRDLITSFRESSRDPFPNWVGN